MTRLDAGDTQSAQHKDLSNHLLDSLSRNDWEAVIPMNAKKTSEPTSGALSFDNIYHATTSTDLPITSQGAATQSKDLPTTQSKDLSAINKDMNQDIANLTGDEQSLYLHRNDVDKASKQSTYQQELSKLNTDEKSLHGDVMGFLKQSESTSNFKDFSATLEGDHKDLKTVADGLYHMGLKQEASDTTAYYPLSHYEHHFDKTGTGGGGGGTGGDGGGGGTGGGGGGTGGDGGGGGTGSGDLPNGQKFTNLESQAWHHNTQDSGTHGIGGSGDNPAIQTSYKDGVLNYTSTGGAYADTLISNGQKFNPNDNTFRLSYDMNPSAATFGNEQASEHDMVLTNKDGMQAQAASQFNYSEKAPAGKVWFQTNDMATGKWTNAALVDIPKPGEWNSVAMTVKLNDKNQYEYTGLTVNGKSYAFEPGSNLFSMQKENWTRNEVVTQIQEDFRGKGGTISQQYRNVQVEAGIS